MTFREAGVPIRELHMQLAQDTEELEEPWAACQQGEPHVGDSSRQAATAPGPVPTFAE